MTWEKLREDYHRSIAANLLTVDKAGVPNNADRHSAISVALAQGIAEELPTKLRRAVSTGQTSGKSFEAITAAYLKKAFQLLNHLRSGTFDFYIGKSIEEFDQYEHLSTLVEVLKNNRVLRATLGDYIISPDIVVGRRTVSDSEINKKQRLITRAEDARLTPLRSANSKFPILHASISCKWTIRSDRSQNARTEGLNLVRNRKGRTPHIVIVTGEPYPSRISSIALGTGDIDCVYHFALPELVSASKVLKNEAVDETLSILIEGKRLRDIGDLPFDLVPLQLNKRTVRGGATLEISRVTGQNCVII